MEFSVAKETELMKKRQEGGQRKRSFVLAVDLEGWPNFDLIYGQGMHQLGGIFYANHNLCMSALSESKLGTLRKVFPGHSFFKPPLPLTTDIEYRVLRLFMFTSEH